MWKLLPLLLVPFSSVADHLDVVANPVGDAVDVVVSNHTSDEVSFVMPRIEVRSGEAWGVFRADVSCACNTKCRYPAFVLKPEQSLTITWDSKSSVCNAAIENGDYRVVIDGRRMASGKEKSVVGVSNDF